MRQLPINAHEHLNLTLRCLPVFGPLLEHTEHFRPICAVTGSRDIQCSRLVEQCTFSLQGTPF